MTDLSRTHTVSPTTLTLASDEREGTALLHTIARAIDDRKGENIVMLRVAEVSYIADYFVVATGFSRVQGRAISQSIQDRVEEEHQRRPLRVEGQAEGSWILLDYGDTIVHVLLPDERDFYNLEAFWGHAERLQWSPGNDGVN